MSIAGAPAAAPRDPRVEPPQGKAAASRWRRWPQRAAWALLALLVGSWGSFNAAVAWWAYPPGAERMPVGGTMIMDREGVELAAFVGEGGSWHFPLSQEGVSEHLRRAIVAVEDGRFYEHDGVDWWSVGGAVRGNLVAGGVARGASTITMQVHRLRDPRPRSLLWKIEQAIRAEQLERKATKQAILLEYINRAPFGGNLVGAEAASWRYFGRACRDLSLGEAALLAGLPQNPEKLRPDRYPEAAARRRGHVLDRMAACGFITTEQAAEAKAEPVEALWRDLPQDQWARDGLLPALITAREANDAAGVIRTTIDRRVQQRAARELRQALGNLRHSRVNAAAAVVMDVASADVLASVSLCDEAPALDLTRRPRSTGSTLKPFIYALAFETGISSPQAIVDDSPTAWAGYVPGNYDGAYGGRMTAARALASSRNVPALQLLAKVGVVDAVDVMRQSGLRTLAQRPETYGLSLAIGGGEATVVEMAEAYATLARHGRHLSSRIVSDTARGSASSPIPAGATQDGASLARAELEPDDLPVLTRRACGEVLAALSETGRTRELCAEAAERGVAWKTGTSSGHRDAWCVAVTSRRVVVVWMGTLKGDGTSVLVGAGVAAPVALRLAAGLDERVTDWSREQLNDPERGDTQRQSQTSRPANPGVTVLSPRAGVDILRDPDRPAETQRVALEAISGAGGRLWWLSNGEPVGEVRSGERLWWTAPPGEHDLRVVDERGQAARVVVTVR